jgi:hypothetical protein
MVNQQPPETLWFRHQFEKSVSYCALCEAKRLANGDFEKARKIFIPMKKRKSRAKVTCRKND